MPLLDIQAQTRSTVAFRTVGCRLNQCETAQMQEALLAAGFRLVDWDEPADVRVVNTCTVTAKSDRTCRHEIRLGQAPRPRAACVAVTGCFAQVDPEAVAAIPGVDLVLGNLDKLRLAEHLAAPRRRRAPARRRRDHGAAAVSVSPYPEQPELRGRVLHPLPRPHPGLSQDPDRLRLPLRLLHRPAGPRPGAQHAPGRGPGSRCACWPPATTARWCSPASTWAAGDATPAKGSLADLLALLAATRDGGPGRYRLSSIEPLETDEALQRRRRPGRRPGGAALPPAAAERVRLRARGAWTAPTPPPSTWRWSTALARRFPDAALGADVIVGFPGETDAEFEETLALVETLSAHLPARLRLQRPARAPAPPPWSPRSAPRSSRSAASACAR